MAINYDTLGLKTYRQPTYNTSGYRPTPRAYNPYPLYGIGTGRASGTGEVGTTVSMEDRGGDEPGATSDTIGGGIDFESGSFLGTVNDYVAEQVESFMGFPEEINQLTGTMRVTGLPDILAAMVPMHMSALMSLGAAVSQANLESIFGKQQAGKPGYGVGTLNNAILGVSPSAISTAFGMSPTEAGVLSGTVPDAPPGISQSAYEAAIMDALQNVQSVPGRPAVSGVGPPSAATIGDITAAVNQAVYGSPDGPDALANTTGIVFGYTQNPFGKPGMMRNPIMTKENLPVTMGGFRSSDFGFDPDFGYDPYDDTNPVQDTAFFDDELDVTPGITADISTANQYGDPNAPGGGEFGGTSPSGNTGTVGTTGNTGSTSMGSNSGMSGPGDMGADGPEGGPDSEDPGGGTDWAMGGRIGMQAGGTAVTEGFVNKDPRTVSDSQGIADNRFTSVPQGSFVMNQPANEMHKDDLDVVLNDAEKQAGPAQNNEDMVDVALSDGERLIRPEVVNFVENKYGVGFLDSINDTGKLEVQRRQVKYGAKIGAAGGGFLADQGMEVKDVGEDVPMEDYQPISEELKAKISKFAAKKPQREQIKSFIKSLSPEDKLTVLFLTETQSTTDPVESMEAIGEVVKNRIGSNYYDFRDIKTLDDALLKQTRKGAFHFSGLEPSTLYARAKEVNKGLADKGLSKAYAAAQNTLDPERDGANRLPANTVFYTRKDAPSQWIRESKDLEFSTELGGHEFYRTFASPELP